MKQRPILFSAPMVRELLDGSKAQTRRAVKGTALKWLEPPVGFTPEFVADPDNHLCPYGQPGDRLWVRESWARTVVFGTPMVVYREGDNRTDYGGPWKPSIHMFRRDSRILLEIVRVRVERLQDISRGDAMAEGCPFPNMADGDEPRKWYADLWEQINGPGSWEVNPWVWVVEFKVVQP